MMILRPHDFENNVLQVSISKNPQKQRKPNTDPAARQKTYWDLRGRWQREYDERLDSLPAEGRADTVAGEIFRAATKLYYDFYNNAMVNNTSGAINYLAKAGVLTRIKQRFNDDANDATVAEDGNDIFETIYPYTIGAKIHFGELNVLYAIEAMLDRTIEFLQAHPKLDTTPNTTDYHEFRDKDEKMCMERCAIRNRMAQEMHTEAARWAKKMEGKRAKKNKKKAQDHIVGVTPSPPSSSEGKRKGRRSKKKDGSGEKPSKNGRYKSKDLAAKFSKLGLFD